LVDLIGANDTQKLWPYKRTLPRSEKGRSMPVAPVGQTRVESQQLPAESHELPARSAVFALSLRNWRSLTNPYVGAGKC
jgi:hypothetical protein